MLWESTDQGHTTDGWQLCPSLISFFYFCPSFHSFKEKSIAWGKRNNHHKKKDSLKCTYPLAMQNTFPSCSCCCPLLVVIEYHKVHTQHSHESYWKSPSLHSTDFCCCFFLKKEKRVISYKVNSVPEYLILSQVKSKKRWQTDKSMAKGEKKTATVSYKTLRTGIIRNMHLHILFSFKRYTFIHLPNWGDPHRRTNYSIKCNQESRQSNSIHRLRKREKENSIQSCVCTLYIYIHTH